jgi:hypothetical protein
MKGSLFHGFWGFLILSFAITACAWDLDYDFPYEAPKIFWEKIFDDSLSREIMSINSIEDTVLLITNISYDYYHVYDGTIEISFIEPISDSIYQHILKNYYGGCGFVESINKGRYLLLLFSDSTNYFVEINKFGDILSKNSIDLPPYWYITSCYKISSSDYIFRLNYKKLIMRYNLNDGIIWQRELLKEKGIDTTKVVLDTNRIMIIYIDYQGPYEFDSKYPRHLIDVLNFNGDTINSKEFIAKDSLTYNDFGMIPYGYIHVGTFSVPGYWTDFIEFFDDNFNSKELKTYFNRKRNNGKAPIQQIIPNTANGFVTLSYYAGDPWIIKFNYNGDPLWGTSIYFEDDIKEIENGYFVYNYSWHVACIPRELTKLEVTILTPDFTRTINSQKSAKLIFATPNPFTNNTTIKLSNNPCSNPRISIFDINGRLIRTLPTNISQTLTWDGKDNQNINLPSGIYFISVQSGESCSSLKLIKTE